MPRYRDAPITAADIKDYLGSQDDFDLELHVHRVAKELGFDSC